MLDGNKWEGDRARCSTNVWCLGLRVIGVWLVEFKRNACPCEGHLLEGMNGENRKNGGLGLCAAS